MSQTPETFDLVIVGGGLCGLTLFKALHKTSKRILLVDRATAMPRSMTQNDRPLVLAHGTHQWLTHAMGITAHQDSAWPIHAVHVSALKTLGHAMLDANDLMLPALGHVVSAKALYADLQPTHNDPDKVYRLDTTLHAWSPETQTMTLSEGDCHYNICAKAVVAADGAQSTVAQCIDQQPHHETCRHAMVLLDVRALKGKNAMFRWHPEGTMAWLPTGPDVGAMVLTHHRDTTPEAWQSPEQLLHEVQALWGHHLQCLPQTLSPGIQHATPCFMRKSMARSGLFWVGNAAHSMPPVGAQGFNLGCRDVAVLAKILTETDPETPWHAASLADAYHTSRIQDCQRTYQAVMRLSKHPRLFNGALPRSTTLLAIDAIPQLKRWIMSHGLGTSID